MRNSLLIALLAVWPTAVMAESAGGIQWTAPAGWKSQGERPMRAATYAVPTAKGDTEPGETAVFYFGAGQGGGVQANLDRWVGQFQSQDGKPLKGKEKVGKRTLAGMVTTTIDLSGTYVAGQGPMMAAKVNKPGFRLLGAIVEGPQGAVFFKFTGPAKTVTANEAAFEALLKSVKK